MKNIFSLILILVTLNANASHLLSGNFTYEYVSSGPGTRTYQIHLDLYRDNTGITMPTSVTVYYKQVNSTTTNSFNASLNTSINALTANCGSSMAAEVHRYSYTITLPAGKVYDFSFSTCCKPSSINNIANPSSQGTYVITRLVTSRYFRSFNNSVVINPSLNSVPVNVRMPFEICQPDPDGDSLSFQIIPLFDGNAATGSAPTNIAYASGYSNAYPLDTNSSVEIDTANRMIVVKSSTQQTALINIRIIEWSKDTTNTYKIMGVSYREMFFSFTSPIWNNPYNVTIDSLGGIQGRDSLYLIVTNAIYPYSDNFDSTDLVLIDPVGDTSVFINGASYVSSNYKELRLSLTDTLKPGYWTLYANNDWSDSSAVYGLCGRKFLDSSIFYVSPPSIKIQGPSDSLYAPGTTTYSVKNYEYVDSVVFNTTNCTIIYTANNFSNFDVSWSGGNATSTIQAIAYYPDGSQSADLLSVEVFGIGVYENELELDIFPNPVSELLLVCGFKESELKDGEYRYIIHNVSGTIISEDLLEDNVIITSSLSSGQYFLTLVNRIDQILLRKSFIKL